MITKWIVGIVSISVVCSIISLITPKNKVGKAVNFIFSLVMLLCMITPIKEISNVKVKSNYEYNAEEFMIKLYRNKVDETVKKYGLEVIEYEVELNIDKITLNKLRIYLPKRLLNRDENNIYNNVKIKEIFSKELYVSESKVEILWID